MNSMLDWFSDLAGPVKLVIIGYLFIIIGCMLNDVKYIYECSVCLGTILVIFAAIYGNIEEEKEHECNGRDEDGDEQEARND